ncbi:MAG: PTS sugar transporter subunit IIA [Spirochaetaceae bacterium]|jgi:phosphocarrier protein FPr|nr:PTS sugar transporter subunit IIA [Spirochaetaceae bacterium]
MVEADIELIIRTGLSFPDKNAALQEAVDLLQGAGCVDPGYMESFLKREYIASTYLDKGLAIPHGTQDNKGMIRKRGVVVLQVPQGVSWGPAQTATVIAAIAAPQESHLLLMRNLVKLLQNDAVMDILKNSSDPEEIRPVFLGCI